MYLHIACTCKYVLLHTQGQPIEFINKWDTHWIGSQPIQGDQ